MPRRPHTRVRACPAASRAADLMTALALAGLLAGAPAARAEGEVNPAEMEAAYLPHIAEFTTWPEGSFADPGAPLVIGVAGKDRSGVAGILRRRIEGKGLSAQKRPIVVRKLPDAGPASRRDFEARLGECHLLFLSGSEGEKWPELRAILDRKAIVTVSEIEGFARRGGMIEFAFDAAKGRVRMYIDVEAVKRAGLRLSSKLLDLKTVVTIVDNPPPGAAGALVGDPRRPG